MREVISSVPPTNSPTLQGAFILTSLVLTGAALGFAAGVLLGLSTAVLGTLLATAFLSIALMAILYHRLFHEHRMMLEYDEELW